MALSELKNDMEGCSRCSSCKWIPFNQVKSWRFAKNCPSITKHNFHSYSGSGKMIMALSVVQGRSELTESVADIVYRCQLCGACEVACKAYRDDIDLTDVLLELRSNCVEQGHLILEHMTMIEALKKEDNVFGEPKAERGKWAEGLDLKNINESSAKTIFHAGCRYSYDDDLWPVVRAAVKIMKAAGEDVGIGGSEEACCGVKAYELGYRGEARNFADDMASRVKASGAGRLVTACSDGYAAFKYYYPLMGIDLGVEVLHITEYIEKALKSGRIRLKEDIPMLATYHDPCHLGRKSEPYLGSWTDDKLLRPMSMKRCGTKGVYEIPRNILRAIPGMNLVEMERIREYAWCCGAGGGVFEAYTDFAEWTSNERIEEALSTGAEALVTACPWCVRMFRDSLQESDSNLGVYDVVELVAKSAGITE